MVSLLVFLIQVLSIQGLAAGVNISMPGCIDECGGVNIPYPFGVGPNCYHDKSYEIVCNDSLHPPKPFLHRYNLEVVDIRYLRTDPRYLSSEDAGQILRVRFPPTNICQSDGAKTANMTSVVRRGYDLRGTPYEYSKLNSLMVKGCGGSVVLKNRGGDVLTGCASLCANNAAAPPKNGTNCFGVGCCQASLLPSTSTDDYPAFFRGQLPEGDETLDYYEIVVDFERLPESNSCSASAALIGTQSVEKLAGQLSNLETLPAVLVWQATFIPSSLIGGSDYSDNVACSYFGSDRVIAQCYCIFPHEGNPYLPNGCQVVEECRRCRRHCDLVANNSGSGTHYTCKKNPLLRPASITGFGSSMGLVLLILGCYWLFKFVRRRQKIKRKEKYFKRNGGLLLQQQMSSSDGVVETTKVFAVTELEKATDNFSKNRILGQGGQGTVYKGMIMDGRTVAIKISKKVDESQVEPFINEVVILSQINHRNVVKLLGCCLETEVPVLVYEFIPNGTLYEHIHGTGEQFHLNWKMRLQIAAESAGAVAYLHSSSSAPIYHRDIKSSNILLDDKYRAKVSDFGTSRTIAIEQTHVTTCVQGTYGYLDPEYFQSNQFTEKSDVYSFGVVLVELITGMKPICPMGSGGWISLATEFLSKMEDNNLFDIIDARISDEGKENELKAVADLARRCLNMNGKLRPTMKEIEMLLHGIRSPNVPILEELKDAELGSFSRYVFSSDDDDTPKGR